VPCVAKQTLGWNMNDRLPNKPQLRTDATLFRRKAERARPLSSRDDRGKKVIDLVGRELGGQPRDCHPSPTPGNTVRYQRRFDGLSLGRRTVEVGEDRWRSKNSGAPRACLGNPGRVSDMRQKTPSGGTRAGGPLGLELWHATTGAVSLSDWRPFRPLPPKRTER